MSHLVLAHYYIMESLGTADLLGNEQGKYGGETGGDWGKGDLVSCTITTRCPQLLLEPLLNLPTVLIT